MKSKFFYGALAVLSLTACSQEEVLDVNRNGDEITFNVVTNKATRAAALYDSNNDPDNFRVWGNLKSGGTSYFAEDLVTKQSDGSWTSSYTRYWPDQALNFFAIAGCDDDLTITGGSTASFTYTVLGETGNTEEKSVANQEDVIYAAALNKTKEQGKVSLNFAHALSQIVFKAKNSNQKLYVVVSGVKVAHLNNSGTFEFTQSTDTEWSENETGNFTANNARAAGSWKTPLTGDATYTIDCTADVELTSTAKDLENTDAAKKLDAMLLMPQTQNAWNKPQNGTASGFYFGLKCRIYNVAGSNYVAGDIQLWGSKTRNTETGKEEFDGGEEYVYIPADINWQPGKKYIYTFNFGNGNGGFEPDPENPENPDPDNPVLIPIEYTVSVDDFDIVEDKTVLVNGEKNTTVTP